MIKFLVPVIVMILFGAPTVAALAPPLEIDHSVPRLISLAFAPVIFALVFLVVSGGMSKPFQKAIIPGKFPRDLKHPVYGPRRLYGLCWTAVFYFSPLYYAFLSVPTLKKVMLRLFGYQGSTNFVVYPDTWIRDLPILTLGDDVYLSNKSTIGTNICLSDGHIFVDTVKIGKGGMIGHLCMVAPGSQMGESAELGVSAAIGIRTKVGNAAKIGPASVINHGANIGDKAEIGTMSYVGIKSLIGENVKLPGGSSIPSGVVIRSQEEADQYFSSETKVLKEKKENLTDLFVLRLQPQQTEK